MTTWRELSDGELVERLVHRDVSYPEAERIVRMRAWLTYDRKIDWLLS